MLGEGSFSVFKDLNGVITMKNNVPVHLPVELTLQQSVQVAPNYRAFGRFKGYLGSIATQIPFHSSDVRQLHFPHAS